MKKFDVKDFLEQFELKFEYVEKEVLTDDGIIYIYFESNKFLLSLEIKENNVNIFDIDISKIKNGFGTKILEFLEEYFENIGYSLTASEILDSAIGFYLKSNFVKQSNGDYLHIR